MKGVAVGRIIESLEFHDERIFRRVRSVLGGEQEDSADAWLVVTHRLKIELYFRQREVCVLNLLSDCDIVTIALAAKRRRVVFSHLQSPELNLTKHRIAFDFRRGLPGADGVEEPIASGCLCQVLYAVGVAERMKRVFPVLNRPGKL